MAYLAKDPVSARLLRLAKEELGDLQLRMLLATGFSKALPHLRFCYLRTVVLRSAGMNIGARSRIMGPLHITGGGDWRTQLTIGSDTIISGPLRIDLEASVSIGDNVYIGHDVMLLSIDHEIGPSERRCGPHSSGPIAIGDGAWIASRVTVLAGVSIGRGAVVAAGAIVTRDVTSNTLVAGVPARVVRSLEPSQPPSVRLRNAVSVEG